MNLLRIPYRFAPLLAALALLGACAGKPPQPEWQRDAHDAAERATRAYLAGDSRVAEQEWTRARQQVARTGSAALLARPESDFVQQAGDVLPFLAPVSGVGPGQGAQPVRRMAG